MKAHSSCARYRRSTAGGPARCARYSTSTWRSSPGAGGGHGTERLRQEHAADHRGQPRGADSGEVLVDGIDLATSRAERARLRRRSIGYVFQDFNLLAGLTASRTSRCRWSSTASAQGGARRRRWARSTSWTWPTRRSLPRRAVGRRAAAGGHRPGGRRRAPAAAGRRADGCARLGQRRRGHAPAPRRDCSGASPVWS